MKYGLWLLLIMVVFSQVNVVAMEDVVSFSITPHTAVSYTVTALLNGNPVIKACCVLPSKTQDLKNEAALLPLISGISCICRENADLELDMGHWLIVQDFFGYVLETLRGRGHHEARISRAIKKKPACLSQVYKVLITDVVKRFVRDHEMKITF